MSHFLVAVLLILDSCTLYDSTPSPSFGFFSLWPCSPILLDPIQRLKHDAWDFSLSWGWSFTLGTNSPPLWWTLTFILETLLLLPQLATLSQAQELLRNSFTALMSNLLSRHLIEVVVPLTQPAVIQQSVLHNIKKPLGSWRLHFAFFLPYVGCAGRLSLLLQLHSAFFFFFSRE